MRRLYAHEPLKPPDIGIECPACHGRMEHTQLPCMDKTHGTNCTRLHFGYQCGSCRGILTEAKVLKQEIKGRWQRHPSSQV